MSETDPRSTFFDRVSKRFDRRLEAGYGPEDLESLAEAYRFEANTLFDDPLARKGARAAIDDELQMALEEIEEGDR